MPVVRKSPFAALIAYYTVGKSSLRIRHVDKANDCDGRHW